MPNNRKSLNFTLTLTYTGYWWYALTMAFPKVNWLNVGYEQEDMVSRKHYKLGL